jgi:triosephosphate isomerase
MREYVIGNLKMNILSPNERERYFTSFKKEIAGKKFVNTKIILCPPFVHLESFVKNLKSKNVGIGAQDVFWETKGAFTGGTSPEMLAKMGAEYVIIGHSERKKYFGETAATANLKIKAALKAGLNPIYCIGEKKEERDGGIEDDIIGIQLEEGLAGIRASQLEKIILVYEPVWSVGSDVVPTCNQIMEMRILIKKMLTGKYGQKWAQKSHILYGGSVNDKTACQTCNEPGADGVLVGRESLIPYELIKIASVIDCNK